MRKFKEFFNLDLFEIFIISALLLFIFAVFNSNQKFGEPVEFYKPIKNEVYTDTLNEEKLLNFMKVLDIQYPEIVLNQAKLETGNFTSNRFKKHNALFGFQTSDTNIIKYKSWKESVIHYKTWQMFRLKDSEDYYDFLIRVKYAEDSLYIKKLKQFKNA